MLVGIIPNDEENLHVHYANTNYKSGACMGIRSLIEQMYISLQGNYKIFSGLHVIKLVFNSV